MDNEHPPCGWSATPMALEGTLFHAKGVITLIDDWLLRGSRSDHEQAERAADFVGRGLANQAGRQRCSRDGTPSKGRPPRGPILTTGEATPSGHSLNARLIRLVVDHDLLDPEVKPILDRCQEDARAGLFAKAMAGFIRHLAGKYDIIRAQTEERVKRFREELRVRWHCKHPRTATILAKLMAAFEVYLDFALEAGGIDSAQHERLFDDQADVIVELSRQHGRYLRRSDPWDQFVEFFRDALLSGAAHLEHMLGGVPEDHDLGVLGWRRETHRIKKDPPAAVGDTPLDGETQGANQPNPEYEERTLRRAQGKRVGWIYGDTVYLIPKTALGEAQAIAHRVGVQLPLTDKTLGRTAHDRGKLLDFEIDRGYTKRQTIGRERLPVYVLEFRTFFPQTDGCFDDDMDPSELAEVFEDLCNPASDRRRKLDNELEA